MKTVIINGQNHKGNTRTVARKLAEKVGGEITEFFLPRDFDEQCLGCRACLRTDMTRCPHYEKLRPLTEAMTEADLIILASPVYVYHATGQMMSFLDHYAIRWMVHRPDERMFFKQGVSICTAAGGGMKRTVRDMADSLLFWGVPKIYKIRFGIGTAELGKFPDKLSQKIDKSLDKTADKIQRNAGKNNRNLKARVWFYFIRFAHIHFEPKIEPDYSYWEERGWHAKSRPWKKK